MAWQQTRDGVLLTIKAVPSARTNECVILRNGEVTIRVTQAADKGKANQAIMTVLAEKLGIAPSRVALVRGHTARRKTLLLLGCTVSDVERQLPSQTAGS